jgi:hypothetical protein
MDYTISKNLDSLIYASNSLAMDALALIILPQHIKDIANFLTNPGAGTATGKSLTGGLILMDGGKEDIFPTATNFRSWSTKTGNSVIGTETSGFAGQNSGYFIKEFEKFGKRHTYSSSMYDCVYLAGLALAYSGPKENAKDYSSGDLKAGFRNFKQGVCTGDEATFGIGPEQFKTTTEHIDRGGCVLYEGASGIIQFDANGDRVEQDMNTYTVNKDGDGWKVLDSYRSDEL